RGGSQLADEVRAVLPGFYFGIIWPGSRITSIRSNAILSAFALRRGKALCILDYGELSRGVWTLRMQRHPLQPRIPDTRRNFRYTQDHARPGASEGRLARLPVPGEFGCKARLGARTRFRGNAVVDASAGRAGGFRDRHGPPVFGARVC